MSPLPSTHDVHLRPMPVYDDRLTRTQRRALAAMPGPVALSLIDQAPASAWLAAPPPGAPRRGLVRRARATLVRRVVARKIAPAAPALAAVALGVVLVAVALGTVLALALSGVVGQDGDDW